MRFPDIGSFEQTEQKFRRIRVCLIENKSRTAKVGAISKAQKSKGDPLETKNLKEVA